MSLFDECVVWGNRAMCRSYAKINLTLDVTGKRENGYHDVKMIMQTVNLFDLIIVDKRKNGISVKSNLEYLPTDERNIAYKAAKLFFEKSGIDAGVSIIMHKNISVKQNYLTDTIFLLFLIKFFRIY
jgi:4-diphosphocytidyl-2-C-methyl-D-erythritol kinase